MDRGCRFTNYQKKRIRQSQRRFARCTHGHYWPELNGQSSLRQRKRNFRLTASVGRRMSCRFLASTLSGRRMSCRFLVSTLSGKSPSGWSVLSTANGASGGFTTCTSPSGFEKSGRSGSHAGANSIKKHGTPVFRQSYGQLRKRRLRTEKSSSGYKTELGFSLARRVPKTCCRAGP